MSQWWDNAEAGRAGRYGDPADLDDRPTLAECEQDERDIAAMRAQYADAAPDYATQRARDILAELRAAVEAAKQEH